MKVRVELSQEDIEDATKFWLGSKGYKVLSLTLDSTDDDGSLVNNIKFSARADVADNSIEITAGNAKRTIK
jgi:hypothetical protein